MTQPAWIPAHSSVTARQICRSIPALDYFRLSPSRFGGASGHKEWHHFLVHADELQVLVNFNSLDDRWVPAGGDREVHRLILMARTVDGWDGDIDRFENRQVSVRPGELYAQLAHNTLMFDGGRYHVSASLQHKALAAELTLEPVTVPMLFHNLRLSRDHRISWLIVPRLVCRGEVTIGTTRYPIEAAVAYHDHNWGTFSWGDDFTWEWGSVQSAGGEWTIVYARTLDRGRAALLGQALALWRGPRFCRFFRDDELVVRPEGHFRCPSPLKLPRVMALLSPGGTQDVPARLLVSARGGRDELEMVFDAEDVFQVIVPNDVGIEGLTVLNEVSGHVSARGTVQGVRVDEKGQGVFEFIRP